MHQAVTQKHKAPVRGLVFGQYQQVQCLAFLALCFLPVFFLAFLPVAAAFFSALAGVGAAAGVLAGAGWGVSAGAGARAGGAGCAAGARGGWASALVVSTAANTAEDRRAIFFMVKTLKVTPAKGVQAL